MTPVDYAKLTPQERKSVREQYVKEQNGLCHHCGAPLNEDPPHDVLRKWVNKRLFPPNFFKYPIHLHHNHDTGMTIGAVHCYCNAVLWQHYGE